MFERLKRLWELSGRITDKEDVKLAKKIQQDFHGEKRMATIVPMTDPLDVFPKEEEYEEHTSNQQSPNS